MRKIAQVFTENIGSLFWCNKKKKKGYTIPTKISLTSQSSKFCVYKAHLYHLSLVGNTWTIPLDKCEITDSNEDGKVLKPNLAAWTRTERLVKAWITATLDAFKTKLGLWVQPTPSLTRNNRVHKKLDWSLSFYNNSMYLHFKHFDIFVFQIACIYPILSQI